MKIFNFTKKTMLIDAFSKLIVRLPTFSFPFLKNILDSNNDEWVVSILKNEIFMQGIMIASPEFYNQVINYELNTDYSKKEKIRLTLLKYVIRSSTRCVPFGLFSGLGVLDNNYTNHSSHGSILIGEMKQFTRLDTSYSCDLIDEINSMHDIRYHLKYYVNTTLYEKSGSYRYVDYVLTSDNIRKYELIQIKKNRYLKEILIKSEKGLEFKELVALLENQGFENVDSTNYVNELIDNKILVSELEPSTIGISNEEKCLKVFQNILKKESENTIIKSMYNLFSDFEEKLNEIDLKTPLDSYNDLTSLQGFIKSNSLNNNQKTINKDLYFETHQNLSNNQKRTLLKGISIYNTLTYFNKDNHKTRLDLFKDEFFSRYEYESVRLVDVLDVESGIGYDFALKSFGIEDNFLTNDFPKNKHKSNKSIEWNTLDSFFARNIENANREFLNNIEIAEKDLTNIYNSEVESPDKNISSTGCVRFSLYKDNEEKEVIYIDSISKSSPNKILGRFSIGNDDINDLVREISLHEDNFFGEDTIIAEIDHLPFSGFGNTLGRANIRKYVISYYGGVQTENNILIPISDLYISYNNDKIVLFSKKLKKKIIPYFTNAFNDDLSNVLPVFKFLFDLHYQYEDAQNGYFDVNKYLDFFKHIPRISCNNIILSKETWFVTKKDFIRNSQDAMHQIINDFNQNCIKLKLPRFFMIVNGDIELLIDVNNSDTIKIFITELKKKKSLILREFLMSNLDSVVLSKENNELQFNNEFFLPFKLNVEKNNEIVITENKRESIERSFPIGSEWIYYKIYLGASMADKILVNLEGKLNLLVKKELVKSYFFIKYNDPDYHLRLRLLLTDVAFFEVVFKEINIHLAKFISNKSINNIVLDTYKRELERYDHHNVVSFENIFFHDSKLVIKILDKVEKTRTSETKWFYCLIVMDIYCNAFGFSNNDKLLFSERLKKVFSDEFKANSEINKFVNEKYLFYKKDLFQFFRDYEDNNLGLNLENFENEIMFELEAFKNYNIEKKIMYMQNIVHMHIIRLLGAQNNRLYEFIIYNFYSKILKHTYFKGISETVT